MTKTTQETTDFYNMLLQQFNFINLSKEGFNNIINSFIANLKLKGLGFDLNNSEIKIMLNKYIYKYIADNLVNSNNKIAIINNFVTKQLKVKTSYILALHELNKIELLLNRLNIKLSDDELITLLKDDIICQNINRIIKSRLYYIRANQLEFLENFPVAKKLIFLYCNKNNINTSFHSDNQIDYQYYRNKTEPLTAEEEIKLFKLLKTGDSIARNILIEKNLKLAYSIANKYRFNDNDLIQEANLGLIQAVDTFDINFNVKFSTFAYQTIKSFVLNYLKKDINGLKLSERTEDLYFNYIKLKNQLYTSLGYIPSIEELASYLNISTNKAMELEKLGKAFSLDQEDKTKEKLLSSSLPIDEEIIKKELDAKVLKLFEDTNLTSNEKFVLIHYFGLYNTTPLDLAQIGRKMGLSRERTRQIKLSALEKLGSTPNIYDYSVFLGNTKASNERLKKILAESKEKKVLKEEQCKRKNDLFRNLDPDILLNLLPTFNDEEQEIIKFKLNYSTNGIVIDNIDIAKQLGTNEATVRKVLKKIIRSYRNYIRESEMANRTR